MMCLQNKYCVGVSFSTYWAIHASSWCYLCNDDNTTTVGYYDFYQRPGNVNWYFIEINLILSNSAWTSINPWIFINKSFEGLSCTCKSLIVNGKGNCQEKPDPATHGGNLFCYVELPSNCKDLIDSSAQPGEKSSSQACTDGICNTLLC